ncbi:MAG: c-type cytochrome [Ignavibacteriae bacterium]|nr:c-type cytochrome [Ignavibacteriota bacterium]
MKKFFKWFGIIVGCLLVIAFVAFLYLIPPFTLAPPETFSQQEIDAAPSVAHISDPATRLIAERGKYLVTVIGCTGCHTSGGEQGPQWEKYLAGGMKFQAKEYGTVISRNLTPDSQTGLARRSDEYVKNVLRSGVDETGNIMLAMPWSAYSNLTVEDQHAVVVYLRNLKSVRHEIPEPQPSTMPDDKNAVESAWGGDYARH